MSLTVDLQVASTGSLAPDPADIERWVASALKQRQSDSEVSVRIVDAEESRSLNHRYRGKDKATNVLSFPSDLPEELDLPLLGDLVVCASIVESEAEEQGKSLDAHWAHMIIHGTLHLLGYDHIEDKDADEMEALETELITALDFPAPYESQNTYSQTPNRSMESP